jgi:ribulose-phosphate 3-epimerase
LIIHREDTIQRMKKIVVAASLACANPICIQKDVEILEESALSAYHFDICDGVFAPTFLLNAAVVKALRPLSSKRFDVHLYCHYPSRYLSTFQESGADIIVVHVESEGERYLNAIRHVRRMGLRAGLAILPTSTIPEDIEEAFEHLSLIVVNTVGPAYSGQPFDPAGIRNLENLAGRLSRHGLDEVELATDGSISVEKLPILLAAGCNHLICGTASIFKPGTDLAQNVVSFYEAVRQAAANLTSGSSG